MKLRSSLDILAGWADAILSSFTAPAPDLAKEWADGFVAGLSHAVAAQCANTMFESIGVPAGSITPPMPLNPHTGRPVLRTPNPGVDLDPQAGDDDA